MDPPECQGHSHDGSGDDDLGLSLRPQIDFSLVKCLNEELPNAGKQVLKLHEERLSSDPYLKSNEDDPELLLYIPFTEAVTVKSLAIRSVAPDGIEASPPRTIKIFSDRDDLDFETARDMEAPCQLELLPPHHFAEGTIDYPLRPAGRFQNISSLTILFVDNYDEEDDMSTIVTYVGVKGKGSGQKRAVVETVYESQGMKKDHKVKGEFGNQQLL
eukprot:scaffold3236_cov66-Cylindrotheca_fusiformis.AAC.28